MGYLSRSRIAASLAAIVAAAMVIPAGARSMEGAGCAWPMKLDTINSAYPDTAAQYWMTRFAAVPGTRLEITAKYPNVRYFSFHTYDDAQRPVDSLADVQIAPRSGVNPFAKLAPDGASGSYKVRVEMSTPAKRRPRNTMYSGRTNEGAPNPMGFLIYRIYTPDIAKQRTGGVPLPNIKLVGPNGAVELEMERCEPFSPPGSSELDEHARDSSYENSTPKVTPVPGATDPPTIERFYGLDWEVIRRFPDNPAKERWPRSTGGFLSNQQIAYLKTHLSRQFGDVVVFRAKAPSYNDTVAGVSPAARRQVRYWSVCQNNLATQRVVDCKADYQSVIGRDGYFTFVISDPDDRPKNATAKRGINWLPYGGIYYDGVIIYRHMLPAKGFSAAIHNVGRDENPAKVMGRYFPVAGYCSTATFEKGGWRACLATRPKT